jgi:hypothetical protein
MLQLDDEDAALVAMRVPVTFLVCLAKLREEERLIASEPDRFAREYRTPRMSFARQVGEVAAEDLATREAMDALEFQALTDRRQR